MTREERTGWRDREISERHRRYGLNCPALDIDFLLLEYDAGRAVAVIEYKHELARLQYPSHPSYRALVDLGDRAGLPVFACRYKTDFSLFKVVPLNTKAKGLLKEAREFLEPKFVEFLYGLRGRVVPAEVLEDLNKNSWI